MGGHYYAYIKSFEDGKWYNFNDAIVSEIGEGSLNEKIQEMFGGNATSAYMLQYRKYDPKTVVNGITQNAQISNDEIPEYLRADLESEIDKLLKESEDLQDKLLRIQVRVYEPQDRNNYKMLNLKKTSTMRELVDLIKQSAVGSKFSDEVDDFCGIDIRDVDPKNLRLRSYDSQLKIKTGVFQDFEDPVNSGKNQFDQSLISLNIHSHFMFKVEIKQSGEEFEAYDPNWLFIRVYDWAALDESYQEDDEFIFQLQDVDKHPFKVIKINPVQGTVADMENSISEACGIPTTDLVVLLRHEQMYNSSVNVEQYNLDWAKTKKVTEMRSKLTHAHCVFVEDNKAKRPYDQLRWYKAMKNEENIFKLFVNFGENSFSVNIQKTKTLGELKDKIGGEIGVPSSQFNIKRQGVVKEMKDTTFNLLRHGITNKAILKVEAGAQHQEGVYEIELTYVQLT